MNNFWMSPTFNLITILFSLIVIIFIGLKYGVNLKDKKLHLLYISGICIFIIIELATYICIQSDHSTEIISYISYASTLSSLILSVVAIIYAIVSNNRSEEQYGKIDTASSKISASLNEFSKKSEELTQGITEVLNRLDEVKNISIETRDCINKINSHDLENPKNIESDIKSRLTVEFSSDNDSNSSQSNNENQEEKKFKEVWEKATHDTINNVVNNYIIGGSIVGNLTLLACVYSYENNKPFNASDIFPPAEQDNNMYMYGYIIASSALGVIKAQYINGRFQVSGYYEAIKSILDTTVKTYISRGDDPNQNYNKTVYENLQRYFGGSSEQK